MGQRFQVAVGVTFLVVGIGMTVHGATVAAGIGVRDGRFEAQECRLSVGGKAQTQNCDGHVTVGVRRLDARYQKSTPPWIDEGDSFEVIWTGDDEPVDVLRADDRIANPLIAPLGVIAFAGAVMLPFMQGWPRWLRRTNAWFTATAAAAWLVCLVAILT